MTDVRCGRCQTQFTVAGPGRYPCPRCGVVNEVRSAVDVPRREPTPLATSPRRTCSECGLSFIVGDIQVAVCPNCGAQVPSGDDS